MARVKKIVEDTTSEEVVNDVEVVEEVEANVYGYTQEDVSQLVEELESTSELPTMVEEVVETTNTPFLNYGGFTVEEVRKLIECKVNGTLSGEQTNRWNSLMDESYRAYGTMRQMVATAGECPSSGVSIGKVLFRYENEPNNDVLFASILKIYNLEQVKLVIAVVQTRTI